jgi:peptidoglycan/LPS O-acetylase OafA/YrhL
MRAGRPKLAFLDGLRGLAALYVMIGHARWLLWEGYSDGYRAHPDRYGLLGKMLVGASAAFRWGHEAVIFFFVLSGFVIHLRYATRLAAGTGDRFDFWPYLARRARRLYPPLVVALLVTFVLDGIGARLSLPTALRATAYPSINSNLGFDHSPVVAARNLVFIMDPVFGSDGPLWSLNYEWYFYLLYPAVFLIARRSWRLGTFCLVALSALGLAPVWPRALLWFQVVCQLMIIWWFGALLADRFAGRLKVRYTTVGWLVLAPVALALRTWGNFAHDIIIGLGFTGLIALCLALHERGRPLSTLARLRPLGAMSYTLYVIHFPILVFVSGWVMQSSGGALPSHFGWAGAGIALCLGVAWALHLVAEKPFSS